MFPLLVSLLLAAQPAPAAEAAASGRTQWLFATVGQSEWCPAGNVRLDLRTGRYAFTARAPRRTCHAPGLERPIVTGRLTGARLAAIRAAAAPIWREGLDDPACRDGRRPQRIVVSNGGTQVLVMTDGRGTLSAPDDLSCWSAAAYDLHARLDEAFRSAEGR